MKCEFEGQNENQKWFSYSKKHCLGVSQSDFVFRKIFIWTKTQKRDLKLNWQPLLWIFFKKLKITTIYLNLHSPHINFPYFSDFIFQLNFVYTNLQHEIVTNEDIIHAWIQFLNVRFGMGRKFIGHVLREQNKLKQLIVFGCSKKM